MRELPMPMNKPAVACCHTETHRFPHPVRTCCHWRGSPSRGSSSFTHIRGVDPRGLRCLNRVGTRASELDDPNTIGTHRKWHPVRCMAQRADLPREDTLAEAAFTQTAKGIRKTREKLQTDVCV